MTCAADKAQHESHCVFDMASPGDKSIAWAGSARVAARQHGVITRRQLLECRLSEGSIRQELKAGRLTMARPGVYVVVGAAPSWLQMVSVACRWGGEGTHASHLTAARLWKLPGFDSNAIHVSTTRNLRTGRGVTVHRVQTWPSSDVARTGCLPVTSPARTLIDVAAVVSTETIEVALDDALRRKLVTLQRLSRRLDEVGARGRDGAAAVRRLLESRSESGSAPESPLETRFIRLLRAARLPAPLRQFAIYDGARFVARVDFAYPEHSLAIELDGYAYHSGRVEWERDRARGNGVQSAGYKLVRFTWAQMDRNPDTVVATVAALTTPRSSF